MRSSLILLTVLSLLLIVESVPSELYSLSQTDEGLLAVIDQPWVVRPAYVATSPEQERAQQNKADQSNQPSQGKNEEQSREKRDASFKNEKLAKRRQSGLWWF